jgi:hypothetical protein
MDKAIALTGIFGMIAIITIVLVVNSSLSGMVIGADDYYVRPSGMTLRSESGVVVLQSEVVTSEMCRNTAFCNGQTRYTCCKHDGTGCILPLDDTTGSCPLSHRSRCQCREDYVAGLVEKYG